MESALNSALAEYNIDANRLTPAEIIEELVLLINNTQ